MRERGRTGGEEARRGRAKEKQRNREKALNDRQ